MTATYIFIGIIIAAIVVVIFYRAKWSRATRKAERGRSEKIEDERIEKAGKSK